MLKLFKRVVERVCHAYKVTSEKNAVVRITRETLAVMLLQSNANYCCSAVDVHIALRFFSFTRTYVFEYSFDLYFSNVPAIYRGFVSAFVANSAAPFDGTFFSLVFLAGVLGTGGQRKNKLSTDENLHLPLDGA